MIPDRFWSPSGMYVCVRPEIGRDGCWLVRVLNFSNYKHRTATFPTEAEARSHANLWRV